MKSSLATIGAAAALISLVGYACSSTTTPGPIAGDAGISDGGVADSAPAPTACVQDTKRVAEDDAGVCCAGLFKACVGLGTEGVSGCICSTVECGTPTMQPPPNVPCCPGIGSSCSMVLGSPTGADTQCTCM